MSDEALDDFLRSVVLSAIGDEDVSVTKMLKCIAQIMNSQGCGLWEIPATTFISYFNQNKLPVPSRLLTVSAWWEGDLTFAMDDVPVDGSPTGWVAQKQISKSVIDIQNKDQGGPKHNQIFWKNQKLRGMCAAPVKFLDYTKGAINVYRKEGEPAFTVDDEKKLEKIATFIPGLFRAIREKIELNLVKQVEELLRDNQDTFLVRRVRRGENLSKQKIKQILYDVCKKVAKAFDCEEVSVFLEDNDTAGKYSLAATTAPCCVNSKTYSILTDSSRLTGHVLFNGDSIAISDIAKIDEDQKTYIASEAFHLRGFESKREYKNARKLLRLNDDDPMPPLSFMAVPIFGDTDWYFDTDLCGVIRCHLPHGGLCYFGQRELDLLHVIARQIGKWWAAWRTRTELETENKAWKALGQKFDVLSNFALVELNQEKPDARKILAKGLQIMENLIPGAELNGVRLFDSSSESLQFVLFGDKAMKVLFPDGKVKMPEKNFPIKAPHFWGVQVYLKGKTKVKHNVRKDKSYTPIFHDVRGMVIAPISIADHKFGVLDLRWTTKSIPPYAESAARLMGQQLGLYLRLAELVKVVQAQRNDAQFAQEIEKRLYEDFSHQLKSPLALATMGVEEAVMSFASAPRLLLVARGQIRRANRVAISIRLLTALSKGTPLGLQLNAFEREELMKRLFELAQDTQELYHSQIKFAVDVPTFYGFSLSHFHTDHEVLEQLLGNILENAGKYGKPSSTVRIYGGINSVGDFFIAVANHGLPLSEGDAEKTKLRGWRSYTARGLGLEGQGIGLWLVDQVMSHQHGTLEVFPSNLQHMTEFRLVFKKQKVSNRL